MEPTSLSDMQREALKAQLIHRIQKLPDEALLQLEAITRHPEKIGGFTAKEAAVTIIPRPAVSIEQTQPRKITIINSPPREVTRREALAYGAGGFMLLLAGLNGAGWLNASNKNQNLRKAVTQLGDPAWSYQLQVACEQMAGRLSALQTLSAAESAVKNVQDKLVMQYQHEHSLALQAFAELQQNTQHMRELFDNQGVEEVLGHLTKLVATKNLGELVAFVGSAFSQFATVVEYSNNAPFLMRAAEELLGALASWFDQTQGIDARLFEPLHGSLFPGLDDLSEKASAASQHWNGDMTLKINAMLEAWKRLNDNVG